MTIREATETALRELGVPEDIIAGAIQKANRNMAGISSGDGLIEAGREGAVIEAIKLKTAWVISNPELVKEMIDTAKAKAMKGN